MQSTWTIYLPSRDFEKTTPVQAPAQVSAPQALSTMATSSSISPPTLPPSILTPPPTVELLSPVRMRKDPQPVKSSDLDVYTGPRLTSTLNTIKTTDSMINISVQL